MLKTRVIPCLLLKGGGLVKTVRFDKPKYVGDPINAAKIFNEKEVDEILVLDIEATKENRKPHIEAITEIDSECFMPMCYGGGIRSIEDIKEILKAGVEKVVINTQAVENPAFIYQASQVFGTQSIVVSIDVRKNMAGDYIVFTHGGTVPTSLDPITLATQMEKMGCGEILLNSIDRDGTMQGYDTGLIRNITQVVTVPVIACGGAGCLAHFAEAIEIGRSSAVAAGSLFVFQGRYRAVLINYPSRRELEDLVS
jgi:cyclase